jgi:hypothetical protein
MLATVELAFRLGRRMKPCTTDATRAQLSALQSAVLTLVALLLSFSFAMAEARYSARLHLVADESNAIETTLLRAAMLPADIRPEVEDLFKRYVEARLRFHEAGIDRQRLQAANDETERLQAQLWERGTQAARRDRRSLPTALFLQSLNQVIDLHTLRLVELKNRVPAAILLFLCGMALIGAGIVGYDCGLTGTRSPVVTTLTMLAFVAVIALILDFDRPEHGFVRVSQSSMVDLHRRQLAPKATTRLLSPYPQPLTD